MAKRRAKAKPKPNKAPLRRKRQTVTASTEREGVVVAGRSFVGSTEPLADWGAWNLDPSFVEPLQRGEPCEVDGLGTFRRSGTIVRWTPAVRLREDVRKALAMNNAFFWADHGYFWLETQLYDYPPEYKKGDKLSLIHI